MNGGSMTSTNDQFLNNKSVGSGGAILNNQLLVCNNDTFTGNSAAFSGGGVDNEGTLISTNSTYSGNSTPFVYGGGGVYNGAIMVSTNDTFAGNSATSTGVTNNGGGISNQGSLTTTNDTIAANLGGGVSNRFKTWNSLNTIVAGNYASTGSPASSDVVNTQATIIARNTLIGDAGSAGGIVGGQNGNIVGAITKTIFQTDSNGNPLLANNGGPTLTIALTTISPALAAGASLTTVTVPIASATSTTLTVASTTFLCAGDAVRIDGEIMIVTGVNAGLNQITVLRGQMGTSAAIHVVNSVILLATDQRGVLRGTPTDLGATSSGSPVSLSAPSSVSMLENTSATFANGIVRLRDVVLPATIDTLTLTVAQGTITLGTTTGLSFIAGANGSATMTVTGTLAALNAAVYQFVYTPANGFYGLDNLALTFTNPTANTTATANIILTVTPLPPTIAAPTLVGVTENSSVALSNGNAISFADINGPNENVTLSVTHGQLNLNTSGLTVTGNGTGSVAMTGTLSAINTAMATLVYAPTTNYYGTDSLRVFVNNTLAGTSNISNVALIVNPLPPTIVSPPSISVRQNASVSFTQGNAISVSDVNGPSEKFTLSVSHGRLNLNGNGVNVVGNGTGTVIVTGALTAVNAALATLVYSPTTQYFGSDTLNLSVTDTVSNTSKSSSVAVTVNEAAPIISAPLFATSAVNSSLAFVTVNSISVVDFNGTSEKMTLSVGHGHLSVSVTNGLTINGNNTSSMSITGSLSALNAALASLVYTPTTGYRGFDSLSLTALDTVTNLASAFTVALTVTFPPQISKPPTLVLNENTSAKFTGSLAISLSDQGGTIEQLILTVHHGALRLNPVAGLSMVGNGTGTVSITGSLANINSALTTLTYTPAQGYFGADTLNLTVGDVANFLATTASTAITVNATTPSIQAPPTVSVTANGILLFTNANTISVADPLGTSEKLIITVQHGTLTLGHTTGLSVSGNGTRSITITGSLAALNAALATLFYKPVANYHGFDTLSLLDIDMATNFASTNRVGITVN